MLATANSAAPTAMIVKLIRYPTRSIMMPQKAAPDFGAAWLKADAKPEVIAMVELFRQSS